MDDLSASQFNALAKVLSFLSSARDFKHLLSPFNLQEIVAEHEDFVISTVPCFHFEAPGNAHTKDSILS